MKAICIFDLFIQQIMKVEIPELPIKNLITCYAQMRPKRASGYRIQLQQIGQKKVVHNYGHGGAGVSLAPGSAIEAVKLVQKILGSYKRVAIMGSGIIGLFTCRHILSKFPGIICTIYADRIPQFGQKQNSKLITSQVAPGLWLPYHHGNSNQQLNRRVCKSSYQQYKKLSLHPQYSKYVKQVNLYEISDDKQLTEDFLSSLVDELKPSLQFSKAIVNNSTEVDCRSCKTLKINMQPFLNSILHDLNEKKVNFVEKRITSDDIKLFKQTVIFNCTGLGSRYLFKDENLKGVKGHLLQFHNPNPSKYNTIVTTNIGQQVVDYYMHDTRILLGLTEQDDQDCEVKKQIVELLLASHQKIMEKYPKLQINSKL